MDNIKTNQDGHEHKHFNKTQLIEQLSEVIEDSTNMATEVLSHFDVILEKIDNLIDSKDLQNEIDGIKNIIFTTMSFLQAQDAQRQKIERVINEMDPQNNKFAPSAKHITGDKDDDMVSDDELEALIAKMT
jgi:hypothetical protein